MPIVHDKYTETGRKFTITDKENKPTGQKVYKAGVGQVNVLDGKEYKPYIWDSEHQVCRYNKYEIRLTTSGIEIWEEARTAKVNPTPSGRTIQFV